MDRNRRTRSTPPRLAGLLLWALLPSDAFEVIAGDLAEEYPEGVLRNGGRAARRWFWNQTLESLLSRWTPGHAVLHHPARFRNQVNRNYSTHRGGTIVTTLVSDLRFAVRSLRKRPALAVISVTAFALGIGLTATAFSIIYGTVIGGLPFERADELIHFERQNLPEGLASLAVTPHDYRDWRDQQRSFVDLAAFVESLAILTGDGQDPERLWGVAIDPIAFDLLRVRPAIGRLFTAEENRPGTDDVVLLSHALWSRRFGADPDIVGRDIRVNDRPVSVVGVMPERFGFPIAEQFWVPLRLDFTSIQRGSGRLDVFGRLRPGVTVDAAKTEFEAIARRLEGAYPETNTGVTASLKTFEEEYVGEQFAGTLYLMLIAAVLVLIVSCANVTNLLLAQSSGRAHEMAVRTAIGAGRWRLMSLVLAEASILAVSGGAIGILIARQGASWFRAAAGAGMLQLPHGPDALFWWDIEVGIVPLLFVGGVTFATALVAGAFPALRASRADVNELLKDESRGASSFRLTRLNRSLVIAEVALATGLLVVSGLMVKSVLNLGELGTDFETDNIMTVRVDPAGDRYADDRARLMLFGELQRAIEALPGVQDVALMSSLPLTPASRANFELAGEVPRSGDDYPRVRSAAVTPEFFDTFGVEMVRGRGFTDQDRAGSQSVAIVNESFAARYFHEEDPLFRQLRLGGRGSVEGWTTIVGVAPDLWMDGYRNQEPVGLYFPLDQSASPDPRLRLGRFGISGVNIAIRAGGSDVWVVRRIAEAIHRVAPDLPVTDMRQMDAVISQSVGRFRVYGRFFIVFGSVALFLASIGLYGVMAFAVSSRTSELGLRMALGATRAEVLGSTLGQGARQLASGVAIGSVIGLWLSRGLARQLYGVEPWDPAVFLTVVAVLVGTGLAACFIPAHRATRIDPVIALRHE